MKPRSLKIKMNVEIRYSIRRDMCEIIDIERRGQAHPWNEAEYLKAANQRQAIGFTAVRGGRVLGYAVVHLKRDVVEIQRLAVDPEFRRHRVGTQIVDKLAAKLHPARRCAMAATVRDSSLAAHLFLKSCGFMALGVDRGCFADTGEDGYVFEYQLKHNSAAPSMAPAGRVGI